MLDGFWGGSRWADNRTDKQKLERRIKDSVLNLVIDRDMSFLKTARKKDTSIIVNNREGGIQEFYHNKRKYISFPSSLEQKFQQWEEDGHNVEELMDSYMKLATNRDVELANAEESEVESVFDDRKKAYKDTTGSDAGLPEDWENIFEYRAVAKDEEEQEKQDEKNKEDAEEGEEGNPSTEVSQRGMSHSSSKEDKATGTKKERVYKWEDTDLAVDGSLNSDVPDNSFQGGNYIPDMHREEHLKALANQIVKSFKGRISKMKTSNPAKRLVNKTLASDIGEKIYANKRGDNGKFLNVNLIIDMSGSMNGEPVKNAVEMIYIFNHIAKMGYLAGSVIWSSTGKRCKSPFPMPTEFVKTMTRTGSAEGLGENLEHFREDLKWADTNICMTDGCLCDDPILKSLYEKERIDIIGVYVNNEAEDLTEYTGSLDRWFTRSLVRKTTEELCEKLIHFSLRAKGNK